MGRRTPSFSSSSAFYALAAALLACGAAPAGVAAKEDFSKQDYCPDGSEASTDLFWRSESSDRFDTRVCMRQENILCCNGKWMVIHKGGDSSIDYFYCLNHPDARGVHVCSGVCCGGDDASACPAPADAGACAAAGGTGRPDGCACTTSSQCAGASKCAGALACATAADCAVPGATCDYIPETTRPAKVDCAEAGSHCWTTYVGDVENTEPRYRNEKPGFWLQHGDPAWHDRNGYRGEETGDAIVFGTNDACDQFCLGTTPNPKYQWDMASDKCLPDSSIHKTLPTTLEERVNCRKDSDCENERARCCDEDLVNESKKKPGDRCVNSKCVNSFLDDITDDFCLKSNKDKSKRDFAKKKCHPRCEKKGLNKCDKYSGVHEGKDCTSDDDCRKGTCEIVTQAWQPVDHWGNAAAANKAADKRFTFPHKDGKATACCKIPLRKTHGAYRILPRTAGEGSDGAQPTVPGARTCALGAAHNGGALVELRGVSGGADARACAADADCRACTLAGQGGDTCPTPECPDSGGGACDAAPAGACLASARPAHYGARVQHHLKCDADGVLFDRLRNDGATAWPAVCTEGANAGLACDPSTAAADCPGKGARCASAWSECDDPARDFVPMPPNDCPSSAAEAGWVAPKWDPVFPYELDEGTCDSGPDHGVYGKYCTNDDHCAGPTSKCTGKSAVVRGGPYGKRYGAAYPVDFSVWHYYPELKQSGGGRVNWRDGVANTYAECVCQDACGKHLRTGARAADDPHPGACYDGGPGSAWHGALDYPLGTCSARSGALSGRACGQFKSGSDCWYCDAESGLLAGEPCSTHTDCHEACPDECVEEGCPACGQLGGDPCCTGGATSCARDTNSCTRKGTCMGSAGPDSCEGGQDANCPACEPDEEERRRYEARCPPGYDCANCGPSHRHLQGFHAAMPGMTCEILFARDAPPLPAGGNGPTSADARCQTGWHYFGHGGHNSCFRVFGKTFPVDSGSRSPAWVASPAGANAFCAENTVEWHHCSATTAVLCKIDADGNVQSSDCPDGETCVRDVGHAATVDTDPQSQFRGGHLAALTGYPPDTMCCTNNEYGFVARLWANGQKHHKIWFSKAADAQSQFATFTAREDDRKVGEGDGGRCGDDGLCGDSSDFSTFDYFVCEKEAGCLPGTYGTCHDMGTSGCACEQCEQGTYNTKHKQVYDGWAVSDTAPHPCVKCEAGKYQAGTGASEVEACVDCEEGHFCPTGSGKDCLSADACAAEMTSCPGGRYKDAKGAADATECDICPGGTFFSSVNSGGEGAVKGACTASEESDLASTCCHKCREGRYGEPQGADGDVREDDSCQDACWAGYKCTAGSKDKQQAFCSRKSSKSGIERVLLPVSDHMPYPESVFCPRETGATPKRVTPGFYSLNTGGVYISESFTEAVCLAAQVSFCEGLPGATSSQRKTCEEKTTCKNAPYFSDGSTGGEVTTSTGKKCVTHFDCGTINPHCSNDNEACVVDDDCEGSTNKCVRSSCDTTCDDASTNAGAPCRSDLECHGSSGVCTGVGASDCGSECAFVDLGTPDPERRPCINMRNDETRCPDGHYCPGGADESGQPVARDGRRHKCPAGKYGNRKKECCALDTQRECEGPTYATYCAWDATAGSDGAGACRAFYHHGGCPNGGSGPVTSAECTAMGGLLPEPDAALCAVGDYTLRPGWITPQCAGNCVRGHYCKEGSVTPHGDDDEISPDNEYRAPCGTVVMSGGAANYFCPDSTCAGGARDGEPCAEPADCVAFKEGGPSLARDCPAFESDAGCPRDYCTWDAGRFPPCDYAVDCGARSGAGKTACETTAGDAACLYEGGQCKRVTCAAGWDGEPRIRASVGYYTVPEDAPREHRYGQLPCDAGHVCANGLRLTRVHWSGGSDGGAGVAGDSQLNLDLSCPALGYQLAPFDAEAAAPTRNAGTGTCAARAAEAPENVADYRLADFPARSAVTGFGVSRFVVRDMDPLVARLEGFGDADDVVYRETHSGPPAPWQYRFVATAPDYWKIESLQFFYSPCPAPSDQGVRAPWGQKGSTVVADYQHYAHRAIGDQRLGYALAGSTTATSSCPLDDMGRPEMQCAGGLKDREACTDDVECAGGGSCKCRGATQATKLVAAVAIVPEADLNNADINHLQKWWKYGAVGPRIVNKVDTHRGKWFGVVLPPGVPRVRNVRVESTKNEGSNFNAQNSPMLKYRDRYPGAEVFAYHNVLAPRDRCLGGGKHGRQCAEDADCDDGTDEAGGPAPKCGSRIDEQVGLVIDVGDGDGSEPVVRVADGDAKAHASGTAFDAPVQTTSSLAFAKVQAATHVRVRGRENWAVFVARAIAVQTTGCTSATSPCLRVEPLCASASPSNAYKQKCVAAAAGEWTAAFPPGTSLEFRARPGRRLFPKNAAEGVKLIDMTGTGPS